MTSLLARLGQFDSRKAAQTIWTTGKRKRAEWICAECRTRTMWQRRGYSDEAARREGTGSGIPGNAGDVEERLSPTARTRGRSAWGFGVDGTPRPTNTAPVSFDQHQPETNEAVSPDADRDDRDQASLWEQFEAIAPDLNTAEDASKSSDNTQELVDRDLPSIADDALLDLDYQIILPTALSNREADLVVRCLYAANRANDLEWLRSIPATTFSEIIRLLEPCNFIAKLANAHVELSSAMVSELGIAPMRQIAFEYTLVLRQIIGIRRSASVALSLDDYKILLRSARDLGNQRMSASVFGNLLRDGLVPTTACYNYYMSAVVWNGIHLAGSRQKVRVVPFNMLGRKQAKPKRHFANYRVGLGGVREVAMKIFNDMLAHGAIANEESFRILITASAREGDVDTVKSVLKKVWNIDVNAILEGQSESSVAPKPLPEHSLLYPTTALLFTIAHAFGINNDIPAALRTIDLVARHYNLAITRNVWSQLFEWTFVLSIRRSLRGKADGSMTGQLPAESLLSLWDTMTGSPYHVQPTMGMYNQLIKNLFRRSWTPKLVEKMREGIALYTEHRKKASRRFRDLTDAIHSRANDGTRRSIEQLRHDWEYADLIRRRDRFWVSRWVRLLLGSFRHWHRHDHQDQLFCYELPPLLWKWGAFAPRIVKYETPTGFVEFTIRTTDEMTQAAKVRVAIREERLELVDSSKRYVGNSWIVRRDGKLPRRLIEEESKSHDDGTT